MAQRCKVCSWRNIVLPELQEDDAAEECHTPLALMRASSTRHPANISIMFAMHQPLPPLWTEIGQTRKLQAASIVGPRPTPVAASGARDLGAGSGAQPPSGSKWLRFPLRNMRPINSTPSAHFQTNTDHIYDYWGRQINRDGEGRFTMYHTCRLETLVRPHPDARGSCGILRDEGMRNGSTHGDGVGVYAYACQPWELFSPGDGFVFLELRMYGCLTKVQSGSKGRYVLKSDQSEASHGALCPDCEVKAMFILHESAPEFVKYSHGSVISQEFQSVD